MINNFVGYLNDNDISCTVRVKRGIDIKAGCGQLAEMIVDRSLYRKPKKSKKTILESLEKIENLDDLESLEVSESIEKLAQDLEEFEEFEKMDGVAI